MQDKQSQIFAHYAANFAQLAYQLEDNRQL